MFKKTFLFRKPCNNTILQSRIMYTLYNLCIICKFQVVVSKTKARIVLLVDLQVFFSDLGSGTEKKINKKTLKMTS